tara:strand:- start:1141 stop:1365 length:225 start_codon:yes stop_codon:yes gene_type:complete
MENRNGDERMEVEITMNYKTPVNEFEKLGEMYPLGSYYRDTVDWFTLRIEHRGNKLEGQHYLPLKIVWFRGDEE